MVRHLHLDFHTRSKEVRGCSVTLVTEKNFTGSDPKFCCQYANDVRFALVKWSFVEAELLLPRNPKEESFKIIFKLAQIVKEFFVSGASGTISDLLDGKSSQNEMAAGLECFDDLTVEGFSLLRFEVHVNECREQ
ncbi:MAG: hypothetical protein ABIP52_20190 [Cyclobacteriaceae bacterium]